MAFLAIQEAVRAGAFALCIAFGVLSLLTGLATLVLAGARGMDPARCRRACWAWLAAAALLWSAAAFVDHLPTQERFVPDSGLQDGRLLERRMPQDGGSDPQLMERSSPTSTSHLPPERTASPCSVRTASGLLAGVAVAPCIPAACVAASSARDVGPTRRVSRVRSTLRPVAPDLAMQSDPVSNSASRAFTAELSDSELEGLTTAGAVLRLVERAAQTGGPGRVLVLRWEELRDWLEELRTERAFEGGAAELVKRAPPEEAA